MGTFTPISVPIVALVPRALGSRLRCIAPTSRLCDSVEDLFDTVRRGGVRLVVGDPAYDNARCADALCRIRTLFPSVALLLYTSLTADNISPLMHVAANGIAEYALYNHNDSPTQLGTLIGRARNGSLVHAMLQELRPELERLTESWRVAVAEIYRRPRRFLVSADLAAMIDTTRQTLHRRLQQAGLYSPRLLVSSGRVLCAIELLSDPRRTVRQTAEELGYHRPEQLTAMVKLLSGFRVQDLRKGVPVTRVAMAIASRLRASDCQLAISNQQQLPAAMSEKPTAQSFSSSVSGEPSAGA